VKNRMLMSILALVGASLLLVGATLAWFTISQTVNNSGIDLALINVDAEVTLELNVNNVWTEVDQLFIQNSVPGDSYDYRLVIYNSGNVSLSSDIILSSLVSGRSNPFGYPNELTLLNVYQISSSNSENDYEIATQTISSAILESQNTYSPNLLIANDFSLGIGSTGYVYFTLSLPGESMTNEYRNLALAIEQIRITLASE